MFTLSKKNLGKVRSEESFGRPPGDEEPPHEKIAQLAHEFYLKRGGEHGHDQEDWLQAETTLKKAASGGER